MNSEHGKAEFPITTEDITVLIEQKVSDLDQYADLSAYGANVEGVTEFSRRGKPKVLISESVHRYENRLRTTLTHEYRHVELHAYLFATEERKLGLVPGQKPSAIYCKRDGIINAKKTDWMEWQAGYARSCGVSAGLRINPWSAGVQSRLYALSELSPQLRQNVLLIKDNDAAGATVEDTETLARHARLAPGTVGFANCVQTHSA